MAECDFNAFDRPDVGVARGVITDDIPLNVYTPDVTAGGGAETSFITPAGGVGRAADIEGLTLEQQTLATAVDDYYDALAGKGIAPSLGRDINNFELDRDGRLRLKAYPDINIINTRTGRPNTLNYVARQMKDGGDAIRQDLGFSDWNPGAGKQGLPPAAASDLNRADQQLSEAASAIETAPLEDLGQGTSEAITSAEKIVDVLTRHTRHVPGPGKVPGGTHKQPRQAHGTG
ncbi:hypothetical protein RRG08_058345 [Elysia crispata]|uniref:Uncharacterized protein n=1 Tax=Elysia crispata TaxID=231223 RepID=A0AAE0YER9_9GAST|nr:hypothetical protein RRG08_058345 [Elysia crispata]